MGGLIHLVTLSLSIGSLIKVESLAVWATGRMFEKGAAFLLAVKPLIDTTADMRGILATNPTIRPQDASLKAQFFGPKSS